MVLNMHGLEYASGLLKDDKEAILAAPELWAYDSQSAKEYQIRLGVYSLGRCSERKAIQRVSVDLKSHKLKKKMRLALRSVEHLYQSLACK